MRQEEDAPSINQEKCTVRERGEENVGVKRSIKKTKRGGGIT